MSGCTYDVLYNTIFIMRDVVYKLVVVEEAGIQLSCDSFVILG